MIKKYLLIGAVTVGMLCAAGIVRADDVAPCEPPDAEECQGPVLSAVSDILLTVSTPDGEAEATYSVTAEDAQDGPIEVSCDPVSGSLFPVGDTQVICTATDSHGNERSRSFFVTVQVEEAPEEEGFDIAASITLPNGCAVTDNTSAVHFYPTSTTTQYLAICALQEAIDENIVDTIAFSDFGIGLFVDSVNGVVAPANSYWQLQHNGVSADTGASLLPVTTGDTVSLVLMEYDPETFVDIGPMGYNVVLTIESLGETYMNVFVPNMCTVSATSSSDADVAADYNFPAESSPSDYLGVCALTAARNDGHVSNFGFIDFGFGLFLDSINEVATDSDFDPFWALSVNGEEAMVGITDVAVEIGDVLALTYAGDTPIVHTIRIIGTYEITAEESEEETPTDTGNTGGGGGGTSHLTFNVPSALAYLSSMQSSDGSFGSSMLSDWVAIAFAAGDPGEAKNTLGAHLTSSSPTLSSAIDYIRHAMALMALGINPYTGASTDYIAPIVTAYDGTQIGDAALENDDIFSLFPLTHAGYSSSDDMVQKIVAFIVSRQRDDGSWTGGVDMTAAAIQALSPLSSLPGVQNALTKAESYLRAQQQPNGGFSNSFATSWSMQAIAALGQQASSWAPSGFYPEDYLASLQQGDGGVETTSASSQTRIWATAYAIPAATGKTWHSLMNSFSKPTGTVAGASTGSATNTETATTTATSTQTVATSTPGVATSTPVAATSTVIAEIVADIQDEGAPQEAFTIRLAQATAPVQENKEITDIVETVPQTTEEATQQVAAAAAAGLDWNLLVLAFLALILFGIAGYIAFVRKYWR